MRCLCLAYGRGPDWTALSGERRAERLAQGDRQGERGALLSVRREPTVVHAWDGPVERSCVPYAVSDALPVGLSIIDASDLDEAVALVAGAPCLVAGDATEVRSLVDTA